LIMSSRKRSRSKSPMRPPPAHLSSIRPDDQVAPLMTPKKVISKKKLPPPTNFCDNESLACVASPCEPIHTPMVSASNKDILLSRLGIEIVKRFQFTLSPQKKRDKKKTQSQEEETVYFLGGRTKTIIKQTEENSELKAKQDNVVEVKAPSMHSIVKSRLVVGTNQCTRALERAVARRNNPDEIDDVVMPSLIFLARDVRPPTILAHIPVLARVLDIPIMLLPGKASSDMGKSLGANKVSILVFLSCSPRIATHEMVQKIQDCHSGIDSYIEFAKSKAPSPAS